MSVVGCRIAEKLGQCALKSSADSDGPVRGSAISRSRRSKGSGACECSGLYDCRETGSVCSEELW